MAIYHCSIKVGSRGAGASACGAAAYRAGDKVQDRETGLTHDYTRKSGVAHNEIILCKNAPEAYRDRETLWNAAQAAERQENGQYYREIEVALPKEMSREQQIEAVREYARENFVAKGMCVDFAIHDKNDGNPHAHIMLTMRGIDSKGRWMPKRKTEYAKDANGERIPIIDKKTGEQKIGAKGRRMWQRIEKDVNDWSDPSNAEKWRAEWAKKCNKYLSEDQKIDHRSYARRGIEHITPTKHEGFAAREIERRGGIAQVCEVNREIRRINAARQALENERNGIIVDLEKARHERALRRHHEEIKKLRSVYNGITREQNSLDRSGALNANTGRRRKEDLIRRAGKSGLRRFAGSPRPSFRELGQARFLPDMPFGGVDSQAPRADLLLPDIERNNVEIERSTGMRDHGVLSASTSGGRDGSRIKDIITRRKAAEKAAIKEQSKRISANASKISAIKSKRETVASKQALDASIKSLKTGAKLAAAEFTKLLPGDAKKLADAAIQTITAAANPANLLPHKAFMNAAKIIMACASQGEKQAAAFLHNPGAAQEKIKSRWDLMTQSEKDQALADAERAFFLDEMGETGLSSFMKNYKPKAMPMPEHDRAKVRTL